MWHRRLNTYWQQWTKYKNRDGRCHGIGNSYEWLSNSFPLSKIINFYYIIYTRFGSRGWTCPGIGSCIMSFLMTDPGISWPPKQEQDFLGFVINLFLQTCALWFSIIPEADNGINLVWFESYQDDKCKNTAVNNTKTGLLTRLVACFLSNGS